VGTSTGVFVFFGERNVIFLTRTWGRRRGAGRRRRSSLRSSRLACSRSSPSQWASLASTWSCQGVTGLAADSQQRSCARYIDASCVTIRVRTHFRMGKLRQLGKSRKWASRARRLLRGHLVDTEGRVRAFLVEDASVRDAPGKHRQRAARRCRRLDVERGHTLTRGRARQMPLGGVSTPRRFNSKSTSRNITESRSLAISPLHSPRA